VGKKTYASDVSECKFLAVDSNVLYVYWV